MNYIISLIFVILLSGCSYTGNLPKFPDYPKSLTECQALTMIDINETRLSEVIKVVTQNYSKYHECSAKVDSFILWHQEQKFIYEGIK